MSKLLYVDIVTLSSCMTALDEPPRTWARALLVGEGVKLYVYGVFHVIHKSRVQKCSYKYSNFTRKLFLFFVI